MKKVIQEKVREEVQYFCDKHPDRECFSELSIASWYGSVFDMTGVTVHLCDECLAALLDDLNKQFGVKSHDIDI